MVDGGGGDVERLTLRYPPSRLAGDYVRATVGFVLTALPASQLPSAGVGFWLLSALGLLFIGLGAHTIRRQTTCIVMSDEAIGCSSGKRTIEWKDVREIRLAYFSTRTDRKNGWMQLTIESSNRKLGVDSRIDDFHTIAAAVLEHTRGY